MSHNSLALMLLLLPLAAPSAVADDDIAPVPEARFAQQPARPASPASPEHDDPPDSKSTAGPGLEKPGQDQPGDPEIRLKGTLSGGSAIASGNNDVKAADAKASLNVRTDLTRLSLSGSWAYAETEGELSARNAAGDIQLDYFPTGEGTFFLTSFSLLRDDFRDLNLRSIFGAGIGYQIFEQPDLDIFLSTGISYVDEQFDEGGDDHGTSVHFSTSAEWTIVEDLLTLIHKGELLPSFEDQDDLIINLDTSLRLKLLHGIFASFGVVWDYDNTPADGQDRDDTRYTVNLGYEFAGGS